MTDTIKIPNLDSAILGIDQRTGRYIYSLDKIIENLEEIHNLDPGEGASLFLNRCYGESDEWIILNDNFKYGQNPRNFFEQSKA